MRYTAEALIKNAAIEIGFSTVGIADVEPTPTSDEVFDRWIDSGMHGEMKYLSGGRDKRHDPTVLLEGARSVVSVGVNYYSKTAESRNDTNSRDGKGVVALYAHGRDYHTVLSEMLTELDRRLKEFFPEMRSKVCVDTQPISERDYAIKSGIAWLGKNTCVISPEYGSWIFLGELITNLPLTVDTPLRSLCGTCTRCIDACPTGALEEAFVLNANKCISYLTIEKRGEIDESFHGAIGTNLFGCDECQHVCPFNRVAKDSFVFGNDLTNPLVDMTLDDIASIADADFRQVTKDSAIRRCKPAGLRRNAKIVSRNQTNMTD